MNNSLFKKFNRSTFKCQTELPFSSYFFVILAFLLISAIVFTISLSNFIPIESFLLSYLLGLIISVICFLAVLFVCCPLLYGLTLQISSCLRGENRKVTFSEAFYSYYHINRNPFRIYRVLLYGLLFSWLGSIVAFAILSIIARIVDPTFLENIVQVIYSNSEDDIAFFLKNYSNQYYFYYSLYCVITNLFIYLSIIYNLRKHESVFYLQNILFTDNKINTISGMDNFFIKRNIASLVGKEHASLDFKINGLGYLICIVTYLAFGILFCFVENFQFFASSFGILISLMAYIFFYVRERIFDNLFYLTYIDLLKSRLNPVLNEYVNQMRNKYDAMFHFSDIGKQNESYNESEVKENKDVNPKAKTGKVDSDGTIDFTNKDDNKKN